MQIWSITIAMDKWSILWLTWRWVGIHHLSCHQWWYLWNFAWCCCKRKLNGFHNLQLALESCSWIPCNGGRQTRRISYRWWPHSSNLGYCGKPVENQIEVEQIFSIVGILNVVVEQRIRSTCSYHEKCLGCDGFVPQCLDHLGDH